MPVSSPPSATTAPPGAMSTATSAQTGVTQSPPLSLRQKMIFATGLAGSFFVNVTGQFVATNLADVQGGMGLAADEGSWLITTYLAGSLAGVVFFGPVVKTFGLRRTYAVCALAFMIAAIGCLASSSFETVVALRGLQGVAAGFFGPIAFAVTFIIMGNGRLALGLTLLSFVLVLPATLSPMLSAYLQLHGGWQTLFVVQVLTGVVMVAAAVKVFSAQPITWEGLRIDWGAILLLVAALGGMAVFLSQGTRHFWFESRTITVALNCAVSAAVGFAVMAKFSRTGAFLAAPFLRRDFSLPIALNLVFRATLVATGYLVPQFLAIVQGYRPENIAALFGWAAVSQLLCLPVVWRLHQWLPGRSIAALGLLLCGAPVIAAAHSTSSTTGEGFYIVVVCFSIGQVLFLVAALGIGGSGLKMPELPTASLAFNVSSIGGAVLGTALASHASIEAEKSYSHGLVEHLTGYNSLVSDRLTSLSALLSSRITDEDAALSGAVSMLGASARKQAWVLAFNDCFLAVGVVLLVAAIAALALPARATRGLNNKDH